MGKVKLVLVGGFWGAGKTTLIAKAVSYFIKQDKRVGIVTNDQAINLVDTNLLKQHGHSVQEVAGGCFCCRFNDFISIADQLICEHKPDVILGEPVGSCTDISATVLQPLKKLHSDKFELAPYSVLIDPLRFIDSLKTDAGSPSLPESALYIYRKQLQEADFIVLNKTDMVSAGQLAEVKDLLNRAFPAIPALTISALTGYDVGKWLDLVTSGRDTAGRRLTEVDYDIYAAGEAALGWLNASFLLRSSGPVDWQDFCRSYLSNIQNQMRSTQAEIAHVKIFLKGAGDDYLSANIVSNKAPIFTSGNLTSAAQDVNLIVNARVHMEPADLRAVVEGCLNAAAADKIRVTVVDIKSFKPGYPKPTHRFGSAV